MKHLVNLPQLVRRLLAGFGSLLILGIVPASATMTDTLDDMSKVKSHSANIRIVNKTVPWLSRSDSRAVRSKPGDAELVYAADKLTGVMIKAYCYGGGGERVSEDRLQLMVSSDGKSYTKLPYRVAKPQRLTDGLPWFMNVITATDALPEGVQFLKVFLPETENNAWWPIITEVQLLGGVESDGFAPVQLDRKN
jgi:hypothetical protein